jgi:glycine hydroxymethyltransferase
MLDLVEVDETVASLVVQERTRQRSTLSMIAAENTAPPAVLQALGSVFGDKTAEGYPGFRYHTGCDVSDELEQLAIDRAKSLFGADHANVQPHCGTNANLAVYQSVLRSGDPVLSMRLSHGGHLSHGSTASITAQLYRFEHYGVAPESELLDYDEVRALARSQHPRLIVAGASSYPRLIDYLTMRSIADEVGAYLLVDMAHVAGLCAGRVIPSPVAIADFVTFTTYKTLGGPHGGVILTKSAHARSVDRAVFPGIQGAAPLAQIAAKAVSLKIASTEAFRRVQLATIQNARVLADGLSTRGNRLVTGGTDNHMVLLDLRPKLLTGDIAEKALESVGILTNRNLIPFDPQTTKRTSGLRIGTSSITARGMRDEQLRQLASIVDRVLVDPESREAKAIARAEVQGLAERFPIAAVDQAEAGSFSSA